MEQLLPVVDVPAQGTLMANKNRNGYMYHFYENFKLENAMNFGHRSTVWNIRKQCVFRKRRLCTAHFPHRYDLLDRRQSRLKVCAAVQ